MNDRPPPERIMKLLTRFREEKDEGGVWLCEYALRLTATALEVARHMARLSSVGFGPRVKLERALGVDLSKRGPE